jgi:hypothetical protein
MNGDPLDELDEQGAEITRLRAEIERLRQQRDHWMAAARAFDDHLATMRVMMMEHPTVRFSEPRY